MSYPRLNRILQKEPDITTAVAAKRLQVGENQIKAWLARRAEELRLSGETTTKED